MLKNGKIIVWKYPIGYKRDGKPLTHVYSKPNPNPTLPRAPCRVGSMLFFFDAGLVRFWLIFLFRVRVGFGMSIYVYVFIFILKNKIYIRYKIFDYFATIVLKYDFVYFYYYYYYGFGFRRELESSVQVGCTPTRAEFIVWSMNVVH